MQNLIGHDNINFTDNIENADYFKSFKYKAELLRNIVAPLAPNDDNGILKIVTIAVPSKYLSNFRRSLEMPSIKCEVELKLKWTKYSAFACSW